MSFKPIAILVIRNHEPLDELMAPWKLYVPVEGHWGDVVTEEEKEEYLEWFKEMWQDFYDDDPESFDSWPEFLTTGKEPTFEDAYEDDDPTYLEETYLRFKKDENGVWRHWIEWEFNPEGWWEGWWEENVFKLKSFESKENSEEDSDMVSRARKGDIENLEELYCDFLIMDGKMLDVDGKVYDNIKDLPDDIELACVGMRDMK